MGVTIKDVARESGVNISTVSRSLSGSYGVHRETRERVLAVANRLHYRPNRVARGLATGRSNSFGLVISDIRNPFFAEVARGAEDAACRAGCDIVLCNTDLDPGKQARYVETLIEKRVDGILMTSVTELSEKEQEHLTSSGVPIVLMNCVASADAFSTVVSDNFEGGAMVARYLVKLGHKKIAHLTGLKRQGNLADRMSGFVQTLQQESDVEVFVLHGDHSFLGGHEMAKKLLSERPEVTAIFAGNDVMAFGVVRAAMEKNLRIPDDLSLVGYDNVDLAGILYPPLTTVHQPKHDIGTKGIELLLNLAADRDATPASHFVLPVELVERQSCRALGEALQVRSAGHSD